MVHDEFNFPSLSVWGIFDYKIIKFLKIHFKCWKYLLNCDILISFYFFCSICIVKFSSKEFQDFRFCLVGVAKDYKLNPRRDNGGFIYAYRMVPTPMGHQNLELVHKTSVSEIPYAMCAYQGKVLIGVGKLLRLYDLGKKKMLRKCENKVSYIQNNI